MKFNIIKNQLVLTAASILLALGAAGSVQAQGRGNNRGSFDSGRGGGERSTQVDRGSQNRTIDRGSLNRGAQAYSGPAKPAGQDFRDGRNQPKPAPVVATRVNPVFDNSRNNNERKPDVNRDQSPNFNSRNDFRDRTLRFDRDRLFYDNLAVGRYRIFRGGSYSYNTDQYGVAFLRQAMSLGYAEGVQAGQADRSNGRNLDFQDLDEYQSGVYGFQEGYVDSSLYQFYFQQGFQRGYQDGFNGSWQYGSYNGGTFTILGSVVDSILSYQRY